MVGFSLAHVRSEATHYSEFVCAVCRDLVDDARVLPCSHVFCRHCVEEWFAPSAGRKTCPTCRKEEIRVEDVRPLREANPLAARILGRVRCTCPLAAQGCPWVGDYSEVHSHLTNSQEHLGGGGNGNGNGNGGGNEAAAAAAERTTVPSCPPSSSTTVFANAEALKAQGDAKYASRSFERAAALYGKAIELAPEEARYYANRGACHFMLQHFEACVDDSDRALERDPRHVKAARRKARALCELSRWEKAKAFLCQFIEDHMQDVDVSPLNDEVAAVDALAKDADEGRAALFRGDFSRAASIFGRVLTTKKQGNNCQALFFVLGAAVAEIGLGHVERALRLTMQALKRGNGNNNGGDAALFKPTACAIRGVALILQDQPDDPGMDFLKEAIRLDPDDDAAKAAVLAVKRLRRDRDDAKKRALVRDFKGAVDAYGPVLDLLATATTTTSNGNKRTGSSGGSSNSKTLLPPLGLVAAASPLAANVYAERATCSLRLGEFAASLRDCARSLYVKDDAVDAHVTKAAALRGLGRHDDALADLAALMERWGSNDPRIRHAYDVAEFEARKKNRPDYYAVLGCRSIATDKELKAAYYQRSREHHPDRHVTASDDDKRKHEQAFKLVGEALEILDNPQKRKLYDDGYDKAAIEERIQAAERAANNHHNRHRHHHHH